MKLPVTEPTGKNLMSVDSKLCTGYNGSRPGSNLFEAACRQTAAVRVTKSAELC